MFLSFGNDLDLVCFDSVESFNSDHFDGSVNLEINFNSNSKDGILSVSSQSEGDVLDVKVYFFGNKVDFSVSPEPEVGGFGIDVSHNGNSDEFNSNSSFLFEFVDDDEGLLLDLFSHNLDLEVHVILEVNNDEMGFLCDPLEFKLDGKVPLGLKINDDLDVVGIESFNFNDVVSIKIVNSVDIDGQESFFFSSEECDVVCGNSLDFYLEFKLKGSFDFSKDSSTFIFEFFDSKGSFSGDSDSDFFK